MLRGLGKNYWAAFPGCRPRQKVGRLLARTRAVLLRACSLIRVKTILKCLLNKKNTRAPAIVISYLCRIRNPLFQSFGWSGVF